MAVCVPDGGAQGAAATAFSAAAAPIAISAGPSRASLIGLAVGLAVAGAALLAAVLLAAAFFALRARDYPAGSGKRALLDPATPVRTAIRADMSCGCNILPPSPWSAQSVASPGCRAVCHFSPLLSPGLACSYSLGSVSDVNLARRLVEQVDCGLSHAAGPHRAERELVGFHTAECNDRARAQV